MAILNPAHLIEQAQRLIEPPDRGPLRQVDVRRAMSSAYYAVFHALAAAFADQFVGKTKRNSAEYVLAYRSVSHRLAKDLCIEASKPAPSRRLAAFIPKGGFGDDMITFSTTFIELQEKRHTADYNPGPHLDASDAAVAIRSAGAAIRALTEAPAERRQRFLSLLAFPPRHSISE
jgi:hypothetical protein